MAERRSRIVIYVTPGERAIIRRRLRGRSWSGYFRQLAIPPRPGSLEDDDEWWHAFSPARKRQIHEFLSQQQAGRPAVKGEEPFPGFDGLAACHTDPEKADIS